MTFEKILVALDGSKNSQIAAEYAFWLSSLLEAEIEGLHVVDPRLVDLFVEPQFAEELGLTKYVQTSEKVFAALRKIGSVILERFTDEARLRNTEIKTHLSEGYIVDEIIKRSAKQDLLIVGHRNKEDSPLPATIRLGSIAERVVCAAGTPVLVAVQPVQEIEQILVAYDGSEASRGALLMGENLAKNTGTKLRAITIISSEDHLSEAKTLATEGESFLREYWPENVFSIKKGSISGAILEESESSSSLLVLGAYGFKDPELNVLGSTTTKVIRESKNSVLVYRPAHVQKSKSGNKQTATSKSN